mmetsp:Transcript_29785/g.41130  ORF Transcript_29785/g.41130 Transcript_29785/m.41130 type:complete len:380 (-) Transcript_29785:89-1228(-)|eukprot:CAMPEP_0196579678 /NCGR_PEP_ID=MMETSP1081-20130531/24444_1 /TAXON_ID=36882 /ORGANISM="Pyramimonas amylifera, Strain CCMP720" /LENGTH=379 /DNA_ID=CAMNT_0041899331 /DNA_START=540 /DNA_END=1679 /DNA_ORIENTATION=-
MYSFENDRDFTTYDSITLDLDTDVVEFCPQPFYQDLLAVGTYALDDTTRSRYGKIHMYQMNSHSGSNENSYTLEWKSSLTTEAVFDIQWAPTHLYSNSAGVKLAQAGADGSVEIYNISSELATNLDCSEDSTGEPTFQAIQKIGCSEEGGLCTSVAWSAPTSPAALIATATSACELVVLDATAPGAMRPTMLLPQAHQLEIWNIAFHRYQSMLLLSGADDCCFKGWDLRLGGGEGADPVLEGLFSNRREHGAGVCCISPSPWQEHVILTGSYDEKIRLWDTRSLSKPIVTTQVSAPGGVWRLKWHPDKRGMLVAACMYGGFCLLNGVDSEGKLEVGNQYCGHDNSKIAYGVDWWKGEGKSIVASCSFYERKVNLWSPVI